MLVPIQKYNVYADNSLLAFSNQCFRYTNCSCEHNVATFPPKLLSQLLCEIFCNPNLYSPATAYSLRPFRGSFAALHRFYAESHLISLSFQEILVNLAAMLIPKQLKSRASPWPGAWAYRIHLEAKCLSSVVCIDRVGQIERMARCRTSGHLEPG